MADTREREQLKYMKFLKEPPTRTAMYYMSAFTVLVAILLAIFAIRPTLLTIDRINSEIKEKQRIYDALDTKISAMVQLDQQYTEFADNLDSLQLIYPTSGNFSLFMSNIDSVVSRNGFVLKGLNFSEYDNDLYDINTLVLAPWAVQISVNGPESNIDNLFDDLEAMPMYPVIDRFSYGETEDDGSKNFSIAMRIYHVENNKFYSSGNESD